MKTMYSNNQNPVPGSRRGTILASLLLLIISLTATGLAAAQTNTTTPYGAGPGSIPNPYTTSPSGVTGLNVTGQTPQPSGTQIPTNSPTGIQALGGVQGSSSAPSMALLYPDPTQYVLSAGDLITVRLYDAPDYLSTVRITKDGTVLLPLIGSVSLGGITIRAAEDLIATRLKTAGMYRDPEVIGIAESSSPQTVSFVGEKSGVFLVQGQRNLLDVLAGAGGLPAGAGRTISIIRPGVEAPILVNLGTTPQDLVKANIPILPHDTIFVERAGAVYMLGAFKQQGALPLQGTTMTLMQAASLAGGPLFAGKYSDMRIVRTIGTERQEVKVDIKRVMFGLDPDPILQSGDIIFLPTQALKQALASGGLQTLISAVSILVIAAYQH